MEKALKINASDNVAVALTDLKKGEIVSDVNILEDIKSGHKFALEDIKQNEAVVKYNNEIGVAIKLIKKGELVHTHNLKSNIRESENYEFSGEVPYKKTESQYMFMGYERANGKVGIRNSIVIIPTVGCVNKTCEIIKKRVKKQTLGRNNRQNDASV
jgi:altronate hydrolase